mmetsp:Transcript_40903/g.56978  ORF Transcript_40903/g.56978 Transcript_40903/m.56978 type:complete len:130 (+) Transcript_40903:55-444(+)
MSTLSEIVKKHSTEQVARKKESEARRLEASAAAQKVSKVLVESLNEGVASVFTTQKQLEMEAKHLQSSLVKYTKLSNQWISMVENFNQALKEIGDVENWAERIEADMHSISQGLEFVQGSGEVPESITL